MNQPHTIERIRETGKGTFAMHSQTGVFYASHHVFNDPAYNLRIGTDGWTPLNQEGIDALTEVFEDCPESPGECCVMDGAADDDEWRREIAREEGMLGGCDAYNEVMGY
jgi:hypothetical protein